MYEETPRSLLYHSYAFVAGAVVIGFGLLVAYVLFPGPDASMSIWTPLVLLLIAIYLGKSHVFTIRMNRRLKQKQEAERSGPR